MDNYYYNLPRESYMASQERERQMNEDKQETSPMTEIRKGVANLKKLLKEFEDSSNQFPAYLVPKKYPDAFTSKEEEEIN